MATDLKGLELNSPEDALKIRDTARRSPGWWIETVLDCKLTDIQRQIVQSVADSPRTAVRSCSGSGKSFIAACAVLWFLYNHHPATVITTAPTFRQVESILWREIATRFNRARVNLSGQLTATRLDIFSDWFAIGLSTDEPERFQGFHNDYILVIGDEASGLSDKVYAAIENPLSTGHSRLLLIGNPTQPIGEFRNCFSSINYRCFHINAFSTPNFALTGITIESIKDGSWKDKVDGKALPCPYLITPQWVSERVEEWGEGSLLWRVYVLGEFPETGVNNLFSLADVDAAVGRKLEATGDKVAALDVSRYGDDETVYVLRQGAKVEKIESWHHQDTVFTTGRVARLIREDKPETTRIDVVGVGAGVVDALKTEGLVIEGVNVGEKAIDSEQFLNRRAELYWLLNKRFVNGEIDIPDDIKLKGQLCDIRYKYTAKGQLQMESKEEMRSRGSRSPDRADALMMAFMARPVSARKKPPVWRY